jgi:hypothetical protein
VSPAGAVWALAEAMPMAAKVAKADTSIFDLDIIKPSLSGF